ncbi:hypothetical protein IEQ34_011308 [Dendrobium chrysotoxum]|uniref:Uncharacterized protein n=1 Tax=Dendrobium chrysotoxum TaxID=161865 RepID=A0AAV7GX55_DENCH|nr:hypothetical protein IEQ34_011308 [Dendrobium chrysotoxum]
MSIDNIPFSLIRPILNLACFTNFVSKVTADIYTDSSEFMKKSIAKVLIESVLDQENEPTNNSRAQFIA